MDDTGGQVEHFPEGLGAEHVVDEVDQTVSLRQFVEVEYIEFLTIYILL